MNPPSARKKEIPLSLFNTCQHLQGNLDGYGSKHHYSGAMQRLGLGRHIVRYNTMFREDLTRSYHPIDMFPD